MIKIHALSFQYPQSLEPVLNDIDFEIEPGTLTLVTGPTGSGKSTLLRCFNGLVPHFSGGTITGQVIVFGSNPIVDGPEVMASKVGFVFQEPEAQFVFDVVEDELAFTLENAGVPRGEIRSRVDQVIHQMDLENIRHRFIRDISGGEKQKVAIAGALVNLPDVLVLDEPTSQLDPQSANNLFTLLTELKDKHNLTIIVSEHRLERLLPFADMIAYIKPDHSLLFGTPQEVLLKMKQVPPIIKIAKHMELSPLPLQVQDFPPSGLHSLNHAENHKKDDLPINQNMLIDIKDLSVNLGRQQILSNVDLQLFSSEVLALIGPNSAGKTTLLRSILGLIPSKGTKSLLGNDLSNMSLNEIIQYIGYLPQNPNDLLFAETVIDELKITLKNHNLPVNDPDIVAFLSKFGLAELQHSYPRDLSVGERQRTALAAITVHQPQIIFLDEPTRGMDYEAKQALSEVLQQWRTEGKAILLVTHDIEFAASLADRVTILEDGRNRYTGSPQVAFSEFLEYQTQVARLFPHSGWITPEDCLSHLSI